MSNNTVLIVEDDRIIAMDIENSLGFMGYMVLGRVSSPYEAIWFTAEQHPSVVLMAVSMNDRDNALGVAEYLKEKYMIPVVFLSTLTDKKLKQRAGNIASDRIIPRMFDNNSLRMVLESAFNQSSTRIAPERVIWGPPQPPVGGTNGYDY